MVSKHMCADIPYTVKIKVNVRCADLVELCRQKNDAMQAMNRGYDYEIVEEFTLLECLEYLGFEDTGDQLQGVVDSDCDICDSDGRLCDKCEGDEDA